MGLTVLIIATCLIFGAVAAISARGPFSLPPIPRPFSARELKRFTPRNTLFLFGPTANHPACRLQRRLLKPAIAALIREDVAVIEVYGSATPSRNGEPMDWLDAALLRHAMDADDGFFLIFVDSEGKSVFRSQAPMITSDILARAGIDGAMPRNPAAKTSPLLKKLRTA